MPDVIFEAQHFQHSVKKRSSSLGALAAPRVFCETVNWKLVRSNFTMVMHSREVKRYKRRKDDNRTTITLKCVLSHSLPALFNRRRNLVSIGHGTGKQPWSLLNSLYTVTLSHFPVTKAKQNVSPPSLGTAVRATVFESPGAFQGNATRKNP